MSNMIAVIIIDKDDQVTHSFTKPSDMDHWRIVLEETNKTYKVVQDILQHGVRIGTIYKEEENEID